MYASSSLMPNLSEIVAYKTKTTRVGYAGGPFNKIISAHAVGLDGALHYIPSFCLQEVWGCALPPLPTLRR
jgi:hypothetical protein